MTLPWMITYALIFVGGPLIVLWLLRPEPSAGAVRRLGLLTFALVVAAMSAPFFPNSGIWPAALLWASWVVSMGLMGHVIRLMVGMPQSRRWTAAVAAAGATVPWFGILIARAVVS